MITQPNLHITLTNKGKKFQS